MGVVDLEIFDAADGALDVGTDGLLDAVDGIDGVDAVDGVDVNGDGLLDGISATEERLTLLSDIAPEAVLQGTFDDIG